MIEVWRFLARQQSCGSRVIAKMLREVGYNLNERIIRYHLRILDERGLTKNLGYAGRVNLIHQYLECL